MARIVGGIATSHGPLLCTPPDIWHLRGDADRKSATHGYRGQVMDYATLAALRAPGFDAEVRPAEQQRRYKACQRSLDGLAARCRAFSADFAVIVGNDQMRDFQGRRWCRRCQRATPSEQHRQRSRLRAKPAWLAPAALAWPKSRSARPHARPAVRVYAAAAPNWAEASDPQSLIEPMTSISRRSKSLPVGADRQNGIPHAFGFVFRQHHATTNRCRRCPWSLNTCLPGTEPSAGTACTGASVMPWGRAWCRPSNPGTARLAWYLIASGGMTHFVIDESAR